MDLGAGFDGVELDLLDTGIGGGGFVGGALVDEFGSAGFDTCVGCVDIVKEDLAGLVAGGCDSVLGASVRVLADGMVENVNRHTF